jgi:iron(III) transport system permease protein
MSDTMPMAQAAAPLIKPKTSKDDRIMVGFILVICLYLLIALAFPLYAMLSKSFSTFAFDLTNFEFQVDSGEGWGETVSAASLNQKLGKFTPADLATSSDGRLAVTEFFPDFSFRSPTRYKFRQVRLETSYLFGTERVADTEWREYGSNDFRRIVIRASSSTGLENYRTYFSTPSLFRSIENSLWIATISTIITVSLAFGFAYALNRSTMRFKGLFRLIAMIPILVPSLLPGIALVYLFGNQGMIKGLLMGESIYGPIGIVMGSVFFTFPHALIIIATALAISDARLYEAAIALRASRWRTFWTVTIPGARYGLISAAFVVFNLVSSASRISRWVR